jgi:cyclopropane-fatty-acyl-phospholipid synthase
MDANIERIRQLGYDDYFVRKWRFFFCSCVPAFDEGNVDVCIFEMVKPT